jgi:cation efflux family protein
MPSSRSTVASVLIQWVFLVTEVAGGVQAHSLSLIIDGVHNLSDEMALGFLVLAYTLRTGLSGRLLRTANIFNSVGFLKEVQPELLVPEPKLLRCHVRAKCRENRCEELPEVIQLVLPIQSSVLASAPPTPPAASRATPSAPTRSPSR